MSLTPLFVASFDNASPFGTWTGSAGATLVNPGRNGKGARTGGGFSDLYVSLPGTFGVVGCAVNNDTGDPRGSLIIFNRPDIDSSLSIELSYVGDGRLYVTARSNIGVTQCLVIPATGISGTGYVYTAFDYAYFEMGVIPQITITPVTVTTSLVEVFGDIYLRVNNLDVWHGQFDNSKVIANADIPDVTFTRLAMISGGKIVYDDIYANPFADPTTDFLGDGKAESNDTDFTIETAQVVETQVVMELEALIVVEPFITQVVQEAHAQKTVYPFLTQVVMEVFGVLMRRRNSPQFMKRFTSFGA